MEGGMSEDRTLACAAAVLIMAGLWAFVMVARLEGVHGDQALLCAAAWPTGAISLMLVFRPRPRAIYWALAGVLPALGMAAWGMNLAHPWEFLGAWTLHTASVFALDWWTRP
jgi:hypothetical protein